MLWELVRWTTVCDESPLIEADDTGDTGDTGVTDLSLSAISDGYSYPGQLQNSTSGTCFIKKFISFIQTVNCWSTGQAIDRVPGA